MFATARNRGGAVRVKLLQDRIEDERFFRARGGYRIAAGIEAVFHGGGVFLLLRRRRAGVVRHKTRRRYRCRGGPRGARRARRQFELALAPASGKRQRGCNGRGKRNTDAQTITG